MKLLLHNRYEYNSNSIYSIANRRGIKTDRINRNNVSSIDMINADVRYYGNTLDVDIFGDLLPINFLEVDVNILPIAPFTNRKIEIKRYSDLIGIKNKFIKPVGSKWFEAKVYAEWDTSVMNCSLQDDLVYVQDIVDFVNEVRCFCLDGNILTASVYKFSREFCPMSYEEDVRNPILGDMVKELALLYPRGVVLDFGYTSDGKWCFIEPNEAWASGLYACDASKCLDVILASQTSKSN
jgi:hypothetical protein